MCRVSTLGTLRYSFLQPFARPSLCRATNFMRQTFTLLWRQALANPERDPVFAWILDEPTTVAIVHLPSKLETVECRLRDPTWVRQKDKPTSGPDRPERLLTTDHPPDIQAGPRQMAFYGGPRLKGNLQAALRALCPQSAILRGTQSASILSSVFGALYPILATERPTRKSDYPFHCLDRLSMIPQRDGPKAARRFGIGLASSPVPGESGVGDDWHWHSHTQSPRARLKRDSVPGATAVHRRGQSVVAPPRRAARRPSKPGTCAQSETPTTRPGLPDRTA